MKALLLLGFLLAGCASAAGIGRQAEPELRAQVCTVWLEISYDSRLDTPQTVEEARANNRARNTYCEGSS